VYEIPNLDRTRKIHRFSGHTEEERFWLKVDIRGEDECWPWTGGLNRGYGWFRIGGMYTGRGERAHRWVLEKKLDRPIKKGHEALHSCDFKPCCNPKHISEGTQQQNLQDMRDRGRSNSWGRENASLR
jgi:hypothetical protein